MEAPNKKSMKDSDFLINTTEADSQIKKISEVINSFSNHLQNIIRTINAFKYQNSRPQQRYDQQNKKYLTYNCFQMKLVSIKEYLQAQKELKQILQKIIKVQQQTKNGKYTQKTAKNQIIFEFTEKLKNCSDLLEKSKNLISFEMSHNDIEYKSKKQCKQHLDQLKEQLNVFINNLVKSVQKNKINSNTKIKNQEKEGKSQDENKVKSTLIRNQEILKNLFNFMSTQQSPKKENKATTNSQNKFKIQNLQFYKQLEQNIRFMFNQTLKIIASSITVEEIRNHYIFMFNYVMNSSKKIEELYEYKSKSVMPEEQFMNHLNQIKKEIQTVNENLQKVMNEKMSEKQLFVIFKSTAQIDFCLQQTSIKYRKKQNIEKALVIIPLISLFNLNQKNNLIQRNTVKIHDFAQKQQEEIQNLKKQIKESKQNRNQPQEDDETHIQQIKVVQCLFGKQEMKEIIEIKLSEHKRLLQDLHKAEIDKLNREFDAKIKELETKVNQKDSKIQELTLKINEFEEVIKNDSKNKNYLFNQETSNKEGQNKEKEIDQFAPSEYERIKSQEVVLVSLNGEIEGKRDDRDELTAQIKQLNERIEKLKAEEQCLLNSINYKKLQVDKLEKQSASKSQRISNQHDSDNLIKKTQQQQKIQFTKQTLNVNQTNSQVIETESQQEKYQQQQVNDQSSSTLNKPSHEPINQRLESNQSKQIRQSSSQESQFSVLTATENQQSNQSKLQQFQKRTLQQKQQKQVTEENQNKKEQQKQQGKVNQVDIQKVQEQASQKNVQINQFEKQLQTLVNNQQDKNPQEKTQQNNIGLMTIQSEEGKNQVTSQIQQSVNQINRNNTDQNNNQNENNLQSEKGNQKLQLVNEQLELQRQTVNKFKQTVTVVEQQLRNMILKTKQTQMYKQLLMENKQKQKQKNNQRQESSQQLFNLDTKQYTVESKEKQTQLTQIVNQMNAFVEQMSKTKFIKFDQLESKLKEMENTHLQSQSQKSNNHNNQLQQVKKQLEEMNNKYLAKQKQLKQKSQQFNESAQRLVLLESQLNEKLKEIETKDNYIKDIDKSVQEKQNQLKKIKQFLIKIINSIDFSGIIQPKQQLDNNENPQQSSSDLQLLIKLFDQSRSNLINSLKNRKSFQTQINSSQQQESKPINQFTQSLSIIITQLNSMLTNIKQQINSYVVKSQQIKTQTLKQKQKLKQLQNSIADLQIKQNDIKTLLAQRLQKQKQAMKQRKQQKQQQLKSIEQQLTTSFIKTIESSLIKTVNITQLNSQIQKLQKELTKEKQLTAKHQQEQQKNQNNIKSLTQTNQSNTQIIHLLQNEITSLKKEIQSLQQSNTQISVQNNKDKQIIAQLTTLKEEKQKQIDAQNIKIKELQQQSKRDLVTISLLQKDKQNLTTQLKKLNQNITELKKQNKEKLNQLNLQSNHISTLFQCQKGKNQANQKQITGLNESVKILYEQKTKHQLENQKIKIQIQNLAKEQKELKQNLKKKENEIEANMIDLNDKTIKQKELNSENSVKIKSLTDQVTQQQKMIEVRDIQIQGLKQIVKQMRNHIVTLQKVQKQKIESDKQVIELNNKIKYLQQQLDTRYRTRTSMYQSSTSEQRQLQKQIQKLQQRQTQMKDFFKIQQSQSAKCVQELKKQILQKDNKIHDFSSQLQKIKCQSQARSIQNFKKFKQDSNKKDKHIKDVQNQLAAAKIEITRLESRQKDNSLEVSQIIQVEENQKYEKTIL